LDITPHHLTKWMGMLVNERRAIFRKEYYGDREGYYIAKDVFRDLKDTLIKQISNEKNHMFFIHSLGNKKLYIISEKIKGTDHAVNIIPVELLKAERTISNYLEVLGCEADDIILMCPAFRRSKQV
jgi:hypothetical protein